MSETDKDIKIAAELPGLDEKDVEVELANGTLARQAEPARQCVLRQSLGTRTYNAPLMPPSLRTRQKWTAINSAAANGSATQCNT